MSSERAMPSEIRHTTHPDGTQTVTVWGEVDIFNADRFDGVLEEAATGGEIVIDLRECRYIDSAAVAAIVRLRKRTQRGIRVIVDGKGAVRRVLEITKLDQIVDLDPIAGKIV